MAKIANPAKSTKSSKPAKAAAPAHPHIVAMAPVESILVKWSDNPRLPRSEKKPNDVLAYDNLIGQGGKEIAQLKSSIEHSGVLLTLVVEPHTDVSNKAIQWKLVDGYRRMAAILALGKRGPKEVPIRIKEAGASLELGITANSDDCRKSVNPVVMAEQVCRAVDIGEQVGKDAREIAASLGLNPSRVSKYLILNTAPDYIKLLSTDLGWSESALFALKSAADGDESTITWDSDELVGAIVAEVGKRGCPSATEVAEIRKRILKAAADAANGDGEEDGEEGEDEGSDTDASEEDLTPNPLGRKNAQEYLRKLGNLFLFAAEEADSANLDPKVLLMSPEADAEARKLFIAGAIYGVLRGATGEVEDVLDAEVDIKRRRHSVVKRIQREVLIAVKRKHRFESVSNPASDEQAVERLLSLSDSSKGDLSDKIATLNAYLDKEVKHMAKAAEADGGPDAEADEEAVPTPAKAKAKAQDKGKDKGKGKK